MTTHAANAQAFMGFTNTVRADTYPFISPASQAKTNEGRSVLVTGASRGVGKAVALGFARAGFTRIALAARSDLTGVEAEVRAAASGHDIEVLRIELDVTSEGSVRAAAEAVEQSFPGGALDVLVNNAGHSSVWTPLGESDPGEWWRTWEVNVKGPYLCSRYFLPLLRRGALRINLIMASIGAVMVSPGAEAYQASKLAVARLAESLAQDYGDGGSGWEGKGEGGGVITIAMHPGGIDTDLAHAMPSNYHAFLTDTPELPGDAVAWLGRERRSWLNGRLINVKWDMKELEARKDEIVAGDLLKFRLTTSFAS